MSTYELPINYGGEIRIEKEPLKEIDTKLGYIFSDDGIEYRHDYMRRAYFEELKSGDGTVLRTIKSDEDGYAGFIDNLHSIAIAKLGDKKPIYVLEAVYPNLRKKTRFIYEYSPEDGFLKTAKIVGGQLELFSAEKTSDSINGFNFELSEITYLPGFYDLNVWGKKYKFELPIFQDEALKEKD